MYFGLHGHDALVPWVWLSIGLMTLAAILLLKPRVYENKKLLVASCRLAFVGVRIEEGIRPRWRRRFGAASASPLGARRRHPAPTP